METKYLALLVDPVLAVARPVDDLVRVRVSVRVRVRVRARDRGSAHLPVAS